MHWLCGRRGAASVWRRAYPGLGNATPHDTISLELSSTGLSFASREASAFRTDTVVVIVFIRVTSRAGKAREPRAFLASRLALTP